MNLMFSLLQPRTWQRPWGLATVVLLLIYAMRVLVLALVLEPMNDEGLWTWNARSDVLGFHDNGLLHQALSPAAYWLWRIVFSLVHPSLCLARVVTALVSLGTAMLVLHNVVKRSGLLSGALALMWLLLDPYAFRAASWAMLEPLLLLCVVSIHHVEQDGNDQPRRDLAMGVLMAVAFAVKITAFWIIAAVLLNRVLRKRWRSLLLTGAVMMVVAVAFYGSIWLTVNQVRFVEIWHFHLDSRTAQGVSAGLPMLLHDAGGVFYLITLATWLVLRGLALHRERTMSTMDMGILLGLAYFLTQSFLPQRYIWPLALIALLELLPRLKSLQAHRTWLPTIGLVATLLVQVGLWLVFVTRASNSGGWAAIEAMDKANAQGFDVAAPPCLAIGARYPVVATSTNLSNMPHPDSFHGVMVWNPIAPNPTATQAWVESLPAMAGHKDIQLGRYLVLWRSSKKSDAGQSQTAAP